LLLTHTLFFFLACGCNFFPTCFPLLMGVIPPVPFQRVKATRLPFFLFLTKIPPVSFSPPPPGGGALASISELLPPSVSGRMSIIFPFLVPERSITSFFLSLYMSVRFSPISVFPRPFCCSPNRDFAGIGFPIKSKQGPILSLLSPLFPQSSKLILPALASSVCVFTSAPFASCSILLSS